MMTGSWSRVAVGRESLTAWRLRGVQEQVLSSSDLGGQEHMTSHLTLAK